MKDISGNGISLKGALKRSTFAFNTIFRPILQVWLACPGHGIPARREENLELCTDGFSFLLRSQGLGLTSPFDSVSFLKAIASNLYVASPEEKIMNFILGNHLQLKQGDRVVRNGYFFASMLIMALLLTSLVFAQPGWASLSHSATHSTGQPTPWWIWPLTLFFTTIAIGILAVLGGVGGGVLFVPIVSGFFPFHLDFVRGAGLLVALSGALAAGPGLLTRNLANLRLSLPVALIASTCAIIGALIGLALPTSIVQVALGGTIVFIAVLLSVGKNVEYPDVPSPDKLSKTLGIEGIYLEESTGKRVSWRIHRSAIGFTLFIVIGIMAGMFGLGAGWANIPVLNLIMGAPLKIAVGTSKFLLSITDTSAAWIYLNQGAVLPLLVVPSMVGVMIGSFIGVRILARVKPAAIRYVVILLLLFAGIRALLKGLGI